MGERFYFGGMEMCQRAQSREFIIFDCEHIIDFDRACSN